MSEIVYGWHPNEGPSFPDGTAGVYVFHSQCAPDLPWVDNRADVSLASKLDGRGRTSCDGCGKPLAGQSGQEEQ